MNKMKILQIAPIGLPVRPDMKYGGTERVIRYLDVVYIDLGHESLVAAPGDSEVCGELIETIPRSTWNIDREDLSKRTVIEGKNWYSQHYKKCIDVILNGRDIDIVHDHPGSGIITSEEFERNKCRIDTPILSTLHGAFSPGNEERNERWKRLISEKRGIYFNAISNSQKKEFENAGVEIEEVIYHGIPTERFGFEDTKGDYLFSIGRISSEKGQHIAIEIAKKSGRPLIIAGEVHSVDGEYWKKKIEPHIDGDQIRFVGSLTDEEKIPYFQNAAAFIFPLQWKEPFGLIMIESMACGTPVIAYSRGSVPEVVRDGETGFVIQETGDKEEDLESMVRAVNNLNSIDPSKCRNHVVENFSIQKEAESYLNLYRRIIENGR